MKSMKWRPKRDRVLRPWRCRLYIW
jgi:hypothetical protein